MHPAAGKLLLQNQAIALARAAGRCEQCRAALPAGTVPISEIDGLPTPEQMRVLCPACARR